MKILFPAIQAGGEPMEKVTLVIEADDEASATLRNGLDDNTKRDVVTASKEGLDGLQTTITLMQATLPILSVLTPILLELIRQKKVKRIRHDGFEIENPTEEQWKAVWENYQLAERKKAT